MVLWSKHFLFKLFSDFSWDRVGMLVKKKIKGIKGGRLHPKHHLLQMECDSKTVLPTQ